jgi:hypothetical protein
VCVCPVLKLSLFGSYDDFVNEQQNNAKSNYCNDDADFTERAGDDCCDADEYNWTSQRGVNRCDLGDEHCRQRKRDDDSDCRQRQRIIDDDSAANADDELDCTTGRHCCAGVIDARRIVGTRARCASQCSTLRHHRWRGVVCMCAHAQHIGGAALLLCLILVLTVVICKVRVRRRGVRALIARCSASERAATATATTALS